jgi:hypothetical protein
MARKVADGVADAIDSFLRINTIDALDVMAKTTTAADFRRSRIFSQLCDHASESQHRLRKPEEICIAAI